MIPEGMYATCLKFKLEAKGAKALSSIMKQDIRLVILPHLLQLYTNTFRLVCQSEKWFLCKKGRE